MNVARLPQVGDGSPELPLQPPTEHPGAARISIGAQLREPVRTERGPAGSVILFVTLRQDGAPGGAALLPIAVRYRVPFEHLHTVELLVPRLQAGHWAIAVGRGLHTAGLGPERVLRLAACDALMPIDEATLFGPAAVPALRHPDPATQAAA